MPRTCSVCTAPSRNDVDRALAEGASFRNIARRFGTTASSVYRHNAHTARTPDPVPE